MEDLYKELQLHPDWDEPMLGAALNARGARYGPDKQEAFSKTIHLERFAKALGRIRSSAVRFWWRLGRPELGADDVVTPSWLVNVGTTDSGNTRHCYVLFFEPLAGNLTRVMSAPCQ
jgi:hypothetical protein